MGQSARRRTRRAATARCAICSGSTWSRQACGSPSAACSRCRSPSTITTPTSFTPPSRTSPRPAPRCSDSNRDLSKSRRTGAEKRVVSQRHRRDAHAVSRRKSGSNAIDKTDLERSALARVLLLPQGVVEIGGTLIEGAGAWFDTHIGARQTRLLKIDLVDAQSAARPKQCGKAASQGDPRHVISNLKHEGMNHTRWPLVELAGAVAA